jgi:hypothetical protein
MSTDDVRKKLGDPKEKDDMQDVFVFSERESALIFYDKEHHVVAIRTDYIGEKNNAPMPKMILGVNIEAKQDGSLHKEVQYPKAGYWVSYTRTAGEAPMTIVTMQKIQ